mmetsp:Transcript_150544/g.484044  ORF Transcript_150544/g.484044 Transcript_150544/m.484044 type:complete len:397 (-) Transcript_150544:90-1280(-)
MTFEPDFAELVGNQDGHGLYLLLHAHASGSAEPSRAAPRRSAGSGGDRDRDRAAASAADFERGLRAGGSSEEGLDAFCAALQSWCALYSSAKKNTNVRWMILPLLQLALAPRSAAVELDRGDKSDSHQKRLMESLREQFQKLHRDRDRREGALVICCELLRLYFSLGQASQCTFLLNAVDQQSLELSVLPKALSLPLCFLWGKHCVFDGNVMGAEKRLGWALANCPLKSFSNRRRILAYLVPCRMRQGRFPRREVLRRYGLECYEAISEAVAAGNVTQFNEELERHESELIRLGTYLVVEQLKLLAYRNLARHVYIIICRELIAAGKEDMKHKQDLLTYEHAFELQDNCDADETICVLANLIYIGAIRGYLSDEHHKVVFGKKDPFPSASSWCPKA